MLCHNFKYTKCSHYKPSQFAFLHPYSPRFPTTAVSIWLANQTQSHRFQRPKLLPKPKDLRLHFATKKETQMKMKALEWVVPYSSSEPWRLWPLPWPGPTAPELGWGPERPGCLPAGRTRFEPSPILGKGSLLWAESERQRRQNVTWHQVYPCQSCHFEHSLLNKCDLKCLTSYPVKTAPAMLPSHSFTC